tara:strand:+ start:201 stop:1235 length:1035 start_codon:yes stop_codon:yes gene_type:complete
MEKNRLKNGKIISPNKLKIKKKFNIGIVGSGRIAEEYIKVIKSFNHKVTVIVSPSKSINAKKLSDKYNSNFSYNFQEAYNEYNEINAWIICTKWHKLKKYFLFCINEKKPFLIEKSITCNSQELKKIKKKRSKNIHIAYNRNFYDYIYFLLKKLNSNQINYIELNIYDTYKKIIKKNGKKIEKYLEYFISSHWLTFILKILKVSNIKISKIRKKIINKSKFSKIYLEFELFKDNRKFYMKYNHLPNIPLNHSIKFYFESEVIDISPIEKLSLITKIDQVKNKNQNHYKKKIQEINVDSKYKPGFRFMYYDFIKSNFFDKNSVLGTNINDLIETYKICEHIKNSR